MFGAGQTAAQAGAAHFQVVALVDGVSLVQQRVDGTGYGLTGIGVQRFVTVDEHAQEPVRAFLFEPDIPQAQAHVLHHRADDVLHCGGCAAGLLMLGFCHVYPLSQKESGPNGPLSVKIIIEQ